MRNPYQATSPHRNNNKIDDCATDDRTLRSQDFPCGFVIYSCSSDFSHEVRHQARIDQIQAYLVEY